jgi:excisionase family DNA binding protein
MSEQNMSPREAANTLGISLCFVYQLLWSGKLAGRKEGKKWIIPVTAVEQRGASSERIAQTA